MRQVMREFQPSHAREAFHAFVGAAAAGGGLVPTKLYGMLGTVSEHHIWGAPNDFSVLLQEAEQAADEELRDDPGPPRGSIENTRVRRHGSVTTRRLSWETSNGTVVSLTWDWDGWASKVVGQMWLALTLHPSHDVEDAREHYRWSAAREAVCRIDPYAAASRDAGDRW